MLLEVSNAFVPLEITSGIIQNTSAISTLELSDDPSVGSGIFIYPLHEHAFSDQELYVRCVDGTARVRVVEPFELNTDSGGSGGSEYVLPIATTSRLGGVKVGAGLACNGNGVLSCTVKGGSDYTLPTASDTVKGGVKVGNGLAMKGDTLNVTLESGGEDNVIESISVDGYIQPVSGKTAYINLSNFAKKSDIPQGALRYKATVQTYYLLPTSGQEIGDVYNIRNAGGTDASGVAIKAGDNVVWSGYDWDVLGGVYDLATQAAHGLMSSYDKKKLDEMNPYGEENQINAIKIDGSLQYVNSNKVAVLDLSYYAKKSDVSRVLRFKYPVYSYAQLPTSGQEVGDVYNVITAGGFTDGDGVAIKAGDNVVWTEGGWDILAGIYEFDNYTLPPATTTDLGGVIVGKGLKVDGAGVLECTIPSGEDAIKRIKLDGTLQSVDSVGTATLDLSAYAKKGDIPSGAFRYKSSVPYFTDLPTESLKAGDVYNIRYAGGKDAYGTSIKAGDNVVWNGGTWDVLSGNFELPTASTSTKGGIKVGNGLQMNGDTLNVTLDSGDKYSVFDGATSITGGTSGLVPAPVAGEQGKFLRADGSWAEANVTLIQNASGSYAVINKEIPAIQGALWQDIIDGDPCLKLRYNDYEYNYYYDFITSAAVITPTLDKTQSQMYTLGTTPSSVDGALWYSVVGGANDFNQGYPILQTHVGNFNYGWLYDTITYKGGNENLVSYLPFESTIDDAFDHTWTVTGTPTIEENPLVDNPNAFGGRALANTGKLAYSFSATGIWTVDFWLTAEASATASAEYYFLRLFFLKNVYTSIGIKNGKLYVQRTDAYDTFDGTSRPLVQLAGERVHIAVSSLGLGTLWVNGKVVSENIKRIKFGSGALETYKNINVVTLYNSYAAKTAPNYPMYIDHFRIHNAVVWNGDFTPPVPEDYFR